MATGGVLGNGSKVGYSTTSPVSWTRVASVFDFTPPTLVPDDVDTDVHSTSLFKKSMPGKIEVGPLLLVLLADLDEGTTPSHDALWDFSQTQETIWWRFEVPADRQQSEFTAFEFQGYVAEYSIEAPKDDAQKINVTIRFDGDSYTKYAAGASAIS